MIANNVTRRMFGGVEKYFYTDFFCSLFYFFISENMNENDHNINAYNECH